MNSYYKILELEDGASEKKIKKAFREMAKRYHPDANSDESSEEKFNQIVTAYRYLIEGKTSSDLCMHALSCIHDTHPIFKYLY